MCNLESVISLNGFIESLHQSKIDNLFQEFFYYSHLLILQPIIQMKLIYLCSFIFLFGSLLNSKGDEQLDVQYLYKFEKTFVELYIKKENHS